MKRKSAAKEAARIRPVHVRVKGRFRVGLMGSAETERSMGIAHIELSTDDVVFAHHRDFEPPELHGELRDGDVVGLEIGRDAKGRRALRIRRRA